MIVTRLSGYVVTEGDWDRELLEIVLEASGIDSVRVIEAGGRSSAVSLACSLLSKWHLPVVLVIDADTVADRLAEVQQQEVSSLLGYSGPPHLWSVVLCKPEIEAALFQAAGIVESALGKPLTEAHKLVAPYAPSVVLAELGGGEAWRQRLLTFLSGHADASRRLSETPILQPIFEFLRRQHQAAA
jgi:hypothetical protein